MGGMTPDSKGYTALLLVLRILLLAVAYVVTGRLALLLAIPPGFATAIFPPVGVGLAAVLLWGNPMVAGVLLGSTLLNVSIAAANGGEFSWRGLLVAFGIAIGSSLHNALGATLIRRYVGFPTSLRDEREVALFLVIGAPLACSISATWGVTVLYLAGAVTGSQYSFSWWTWWVGDGTGVLIATPLMLVFFAKPREFWARRRATVGLPLVIGCIVMVVTFIHASRLEQEGITTRFRDRARLMTSLIKTDFESCSEIVLLVERFFAAAPNSGRIEFSTFAAKMRATHPELIATEWVLRVPAAERAAYERGVRDQGFSEFGFKELNVEQQLVVAGQRDEYIVVNYIEPQEPNARALGFDLMSERTRSAALVWARDHDETTMTAPIHLVQGGPQQATLVIHPVYSGTPTKVRERREQLRGFICAVLDPQFLVDRALAEYPSDEYQLHITDITEANLPRSLIGSIGSASSSNQPAFSYQEVWAVDGRTLEITIAPNAAYVQANRSLQAWVVLAGGLGLCGLLGAFLLIISGRTSHVELLVEQRTQELSAILDNASEAIITFDAAGYIERANPAAAKLFHEPLESLSSRRITDFLPQLDVHAPPSEDGTLEIRGYRRDGTQLTLEMALSGMDIRGRTLYTVMLHDISARKKAERLKDEFVSTVSHELRTPLTSISGSLGLIAGGVVGDIPDDVRELVDIAKINTERLTLLVNDILDLDKLAAGKLDVVCEQHDLRTIIRQSLVQIRGYAERFSITVVIDENDFVAPVIVNVDASRVLQVMANLLSNAIKFSPSGQNVEVFLGVADGDAKVSVHDHGPGIQEDFRERIFEKFAQADGADTRARGGTGLGLSISKAIVERLGGTIGFDTSPGNGSTFYFALPIARSNA